MLRASQIFADNTKFSTLYSILTGEKGLKDGVPVKDANLCAIFGEEWKADLQKWFKEVRAKELPPDQLKTQTAALDLYLKRIELTRYTRTELTTHGLMAQGPGMVEQEAQKFLKQNIAQRLEELTVAKGKEAAQEALDEELKVEAIRSNWTEQKLQQLKSTMAQ
eukprot:NODE_5493_length_647_cov_540.448077_g5329_i0.p2 GENE.NODE_5493_length_647_cov_540.448077_g5329_i0~~NODE_5493_length_647_cov_540.448077_g5329_i0.p2  ORF type:complete len:164 (-),score=53.10 NODE_5493_length_647_cov_540.448077_g5329_i0:97-588(-)